MLTVAAFFCVLAVAFASPIDQATQQKTVLCDKCTEIVNTYITDAYIQQILTQGSKACDSLPGKLGDSCKQLITQYGPEITSQIMSQKDQLCVMAQLCPASKIGQSLKINPFVKDLPMNLPCDGCKLGTTVLNSILSSKLFTADLEALLLAAACPGPTQDPVCASVVQQVYVSLITLITSFANCKTICQPIVNCECA